MKNLILFTLLVLLLVSAQFSSAQTVDDIIHQHADARGGKDKLDSIHSIYMEGTRQMMGNEFTVRQTIEQGKLSRTEFDVGGTTAFILITPKEAWNYIPERSPTPVQMPDDAVAGMQTELDINGPLTDYAAKGHKVELIEKDTLDGAPAYKIKLTTAAGKEIIYWIDATTYLVVQTSQKGGGMFGGGRHNGNTNDAVITVYKNYSAVEGILFPHSIEIKMADGNNGNATTIDKIVLNPPVDTKLYKPE